MRIAVLWDGDGQARLMLESNGHDCVGFELSRRKYEHCLQVGSGRCCNMDPAAASLESFDGVWVNAATARRETWARDIPNRPLWINGEEIK